MKYSKPRLSEIILRTLYVCSAVLGEMDSILTNPYLYAYGLPFERRQIARSVKLLVQTKDLAQEGRGVFAKYQLSSKGEQRVKEKLHAYMDPKFKWDGKWRLVVFDIEEKNRRARDQFRSFLISLGFGQLQKSIWLTPFPVTGVLEEYLTRTSIADNVLVVESMYVGGMTGGQIVERVWRLSTLQEKYELFVEKCRTAPRLTREIKQEFLSLFLRDPFLPKTLMPKKWNREKFIRAYNSLIEKDLSFYSHDRED